MTAAPAPNPPVTITRAQRAVLDQLCADGADNPIIAARLHLAVDTVKSHIKALFRAYGVTTRAALVIAARAGPPAPAKRRRRPLAVVTPITATTHLGPRPGAVLQATRCCHRLTTDLPPRHHITADTDRVTCTGPTWTAR